MTSVALREGGQLASNGNKTLKGYNNNILPFVAFFACKNKWSATERAKDARKFILLYAKKVALSDGGLCLFRKIVYRRMHFNPVVSGTFRYMEV